MKTFVKIAAIAVITAIAALSCEPGITKPHNEWWDEYNKQFDGSTYIDDTESSPDFTITNNIVTGANRVNTITITFPLTADVLKKDDPETELRNFLSFWTFNPDSIVETGNASALTEIRSWEIQRRKGDQIIVDLKTLFTTPCSGVVVKIDGTKYTYSNGKKMDVDGNGITGEAVYDDFYDEQTFADATGSFIPPGNKGWTVTLLNYSTYYGNNDTATEEIVIFASDDISGISQADKDDILSALVGGFKEEKFSDGNWSTHAEADYNEATHSIIARNVSRSHMTGYRVVFEKGSLSLETEKTFFGVKQRIRITGGGKSIYNTRINRTRLEGTSGLYYNRNKRVFYALYNYDSYSSRTNLSVYSKDVFNKNVVLMLEINDSNGIETITTPNTDPPPPDLVTKYYFKKVDLTTFKNNFKIYESNNNSSFSNSSGLREIGITAVVFQRENAGTDINGDNVIYITLDPAYKINNKYKFFYVGEGIGYESNIGVFSDPNILVDNGFKGYYVGNTIF